MIAKKFLATMQQRMIYNAFYALNAFSQGAHSDRVPFGGDRRSKAQTSTPLLANNACSGSAHKRVKAQITCLRERRVTYACSTTHSLERPTWHALSSVVQGSDNYIASVSARIELLPPSKQ